MGHANRLASIITAVCLIVFVHTSTAGIIRNDVADGNSISGSNATTPRPEVESLAAMTTTQPQTASTAPTGHIAQPFAEAAALDEQPSTVTSTTKSAAAFLRHDEENAVGKMENIVEKRPTFVVPHSTVAPFTSTPPNRQPISESSTGTNHDDNDNTNSVVAVDTLPDDVVQTPIAANVSTTEPSKRTTKRLKDDHMHQRNNALFAKPLAPPPQSVTKLTPLLADRENEINQTASHGVMQSIQMLRAAEIETQGESMLRPDETHQVLSSTPPAEAAAPLDTSINEVQHSNATTAGTSQPPPQMNVNKGLMDWVSVINHDTLSNNIMAMMPPIEEPTAVDASAEKVSASSTTDAPMKNATENHIDSPIANANVPSATHKSTVQALPQPPMPSSSSSKPTAFAHSAVDDDSGNGTATGWTQAKRRRPQSELTADDADDVVLPPPTNHPSATDINNLEDDDGGGGGDDPIGSSTPMTEYSDDVSGTTIVAVVAANNDDAVATTTDSEDLSADVRFETTTSTIDMFSESVTASATTAAPTDVTTTAADSETTVQPFTTTAVPISSLETTTETEVDVERIATTAAAEPEEEDTTMAPIIVGGDTITTEPPPTTTSSSTSERTSSIASHDGLLTTTSTTPAADVTQQHRTTTTTTTTEASAEIDDSVEDMRELAHGTQHSMGAIVDTADSTTEHMWIVPAETQTVTTTSKTTSTSTKAAAVQPPIPLTPSPPLHVASDTRAPGTDAAMEAAFDFNGIDGVQEDEQPTDVNAIIAISVSVVGVVCLILLVGFLYVMRKRQKLLSYSQRCRPIGLDAYSLDNMSTFNSTRRKGGLQQSKRAYGNAAFEDHALKKHPLTAATIGTFVTHRQEIYEEFGGLPTVTAHIDDVPVGCEDKNRFANIVPLPETRCFLLPTADGDAKSEYVNANFVKGPQDKTNYYIATQAPLENTVADFWRLVWEQNSRVVVMATDLIEDGVERCAEYLPSSVVLDNQLSFGDFHIELKCREVKDKYAVSTVHVRNTLTDTWREIVHVWYQWPAGQMSGAPVGEEATIVAMLLEVRVLLKRAPVGDDVGVLVNGQLASINGSDTKSAATAAATEGSASTTEATATSDGLQVPSDTAVKTRSLTRFQGPLTVHCSSGTGRTGTLIACDIAMRSLEQPGRAIDVPNIVYFVRNGRAGAVATREQYEFIYKLANTYAAKLIEPDK